ncbi:MAG: DUF721 domain-containing protein [Spirochaetales bacterium]|nr:DUF721 domain-containing protein [Spirochaetales bacterium]
MDEQRLKAYLESFISQKTGPTGEESFHLVSRWESVLLDVPALAKRHPARHCRIEEWKNSVVTITADHPAWLQLLLLYEAPLLASLRRRVPELKITGLKFRYGDLPAPSEAPKTKIIPEPISAEEEKNRQELLKKLEDLIKLHRE